MRIKSVEKNFLREAKTVEKVENPKFMQEDFPAFPQGSVEAHLSSINLKNICLDKQLN